VLRLQEHDGVAEALGMFDDAGQPDRDTMLRGVNDAARTVAYALDVAWRRIDTAARVARSPLRRLFGPGAPAGPSYRMTTTSPRPIRFALTASNA